MSHILTASARTYVCDGWARPTIACHSVVSGVTDTPPGWTHTADGDDLCPLHTPEES